jgi:inositol phosphorylceramide mannosyltransferase catalytic subunit
MRPAALHLVRMPLGGSAISNDSAIPKKIHQIYFASGLSTPLRANVEEIKRLNPGWDYVLFDGGMAEDFIRTHYGLDVLRSYLRLDPRYYAARADLLRYLVVHQEGGVYLDIKTRFEGPIERFIKGDEGFVLAQWRNGPGEIHEGFGLHPDLADVPGGEFQNFHVIGASGHPFLAAAIETVLRNIHDYAPWHSVGRNGVIRVAGPIAYTKAIYPLIDAYPCRRFRHEGEVGIQYSVEGAYSGVDATSHYSKLETPVVQLSRAGTLASRLFVKLRTLKAAVNGRRT